MQIYVNSATFFRSLEKNPIKYFLRFLVLQSIHVVILEFEELFFFPSTFILSLFLGSSQGLATTSALVLSFEQLTNFFSFFFNRLGQMTELSLNHFLTSLSQSISDWLLLLSLIVVT